MEYRSDDGGRGLGKFGTHLAQIVIADLVGARCAFLHQPADQRACAHSCAAAENTASGCVVVVHLVRVPLRIPSLASGPFVDVAPI